jgi:hypothetical protein
MASEFCQGPLWNSTLSWDTDNPNLTECLRETLLPGVPCGLFWLTLPIWWYWVRNYQPKLRLRLHDNKTRPDLKDRLTWLFVSKLAVNIIVILNTAGELAWRHNQTPDLSGSELFYLCCLFLTSTLALIMTTAEKVYLIRSSASLSLIWPALTICSLPTFKVDVEYLIDNSFGKIFLKAFLFNKNVDKIQCFRF